MSKIFESIKQGLTEAVGHAKGTSAGAGVRVSQSQAIDCNELRQHNGITKEQFAQLALLAVELESGETSPESAAQRIRSLVACVVPNKKVRRGRPPGRKSEAETSSVKRAKEYFEAVFLSDEKPAEAARRIATSWQVAESTVYKDASRHEWRFEEIFSTAIDNLNCSVGKLIYDAYFESLLEAFEKKMHGGGCDDKIINLALKEFDEYMKRRSLPDRRILTELGRIRIDELERDPSILLALRNPGIRHKIKGIKIPGFPDDAGGSTA